MSSIKNKALLIAQKYLGMQPSDLGCKDWREMTDKLADEIVELSKQHHKMNSNFLIVGVGDDNAMAIRPIHESLLKQIKNEKPFEFPVSNEGKFGFGETRNVYLLTDVAKIKTEDLLGKTKKLKAEVNEMEKQGQRGVTNNRKIKVRKKAKNGKKKK
jgi:hypothetical protein